MRARVLGLWSTLLGAACGSGSAASPPDASVDGQTSMGEAGSADDSSDASTQVDGASADAGDAGVPADGPAAQDAPVDCGLDVSGSLPALVGRIRSAMQATGGSGSGVLAVPSATARDAFAKTVQAALGGDAVAACALPSSYRLVRLVDPAAGALLVVAEVNVAGVPAPVLYYGTFAAPATVHSPSRALVVEAPHPLFDLDTELQATAVFVASGARYLLVAGTHRCADADASACTGTTTACAASGSEPYRVSDAAHEDGLPFQAVHTRLSDGDASLTFLQLHGNGEPCPEALVSDGSGAWTSTGTAAMLASALAARGVTIGECGAGYPTATCDLCGTDNVQARYTAGSSMACSAPGLHYGRFVHVEQQLGLRGSPDAGAGGWQPMIDAVNAVFPAN